jgi:hypothetical protein
MNNLKYLLFSCTFLVYFLASCQSNNKQIKQDQTNNNSKSVETQEANTKYPPAFPGQTRINKVATKTPYEVKIQRFKTTMGNHSNARRPLFDYRKVR